MIIADDDDDDDDDGMVYIVHVVNIVCILYMYNVL